MAGNPWGQAAESYGQGLNNLTQIQAQGYDQMGKLPLNLYDRFQAGYMQAQQMAMQKAAQERADAETARKAALEEETLRHNRATESYNIERNNRADRYNQMKDLNLITDDISSNFEEGSKGMYEARLINHFLASNPHGTPQQAKDFADKYMPKPIQAAVPETTRLQIGEQGQPADWGDVTVPGKPEIPYEGIKVREFKQKAAEKKLADERALAEAKRRENKDEWEKLKFENSTANFQNALLLLSNRQRGSAIDMEDPSMKASIHELARQSLIEGKLPEGLGMGANSPIRKEVIKVRGDMILEAGGDINLAVNRARNLADRKSLGDITSMTDKMEAFSNTAIKNFDLYESKIREAGNTTSPYLNKPLNAVAKLGAGNEKVAAAAAAGQVAIMEAARVLNSPTGAGVVSDNARKELEELLPGGPQNATLGQAIAVGEVLRQDIENRKSTYRGQIGEISGRTGAGLNSKGGVQGGGGGQVGVDQERTQALAAIDRLTAAKDTAGILKVRARYKARTGKDL